MSNDAIRPGDIRVIVNGEHLRKRVARDLASELRPLGVRVEEQTRQSLRGSDDLVIVTTAHSFKGYEGEVVAVPAADKFVISEKAAGNGRDRILPEPLYVALTRARSLLYVSAIQRSSGSPGALIVDALQTSIEDLRSPPRETSACTPLEERLEVLERIGGQHRDWLEAIVRDFSAHTGPILRTDGSIVAEPLFSIRTATGGVLAPRLFGSGLLDIGVSERRQRRSEGRPSASTATAHRQGG